MEQIPALPSSSGVGTTHSRGPSCDSAYQIARQGLASTRILANPLRLKANHFYDSDTKIRRSQIMTPPLLIFNVFQPRHHFATNIGPEMRSALSVHKLWFEDHGIL